MESIKIQTMNAQAFSRFGDLIDFNRKPDYAINNDMCDRYHALASLDMIGEDARTVISLGRAKPYKLPLKLNMMERHPLGSQAFIPLAPISFLVIVAPDIDGKPGRPFAFMTEAGQGIQYHRNIWHSVLTPLNNHADFLIVDRDGNGNNLEEYFFEEPFIVAVN